MPAIPHWLTLLAFACIPSFSLAEDRAAPPTPAVVELFTSEGCSSCPPADALAAKLVAAHSLADRPVLVLAFHVDYWNHLGWADPFSSSAYSARQQSYARALGLGEVYTPQIIVNGISQCIGSDSRAVTQAVAATPPSQADIALSFSPATDNTHPLDISVTGASAGALLNIAVVERSLTTEVQHGENANRTLHHENVVRWFQTLPLPPNGKAHLTLPDLKNVNLQHASLIAYLQKPGPSQILAATQIQFPS